MLQRAASNAYSWWWVSHIRTKQSKWMEQNLQDMEEKVQTVLKLLEEEGDSFAKRAEMYYKRRPELISFVEDTFKAYRALAERYDHISTELQNANNTIASVFPDRVPLMDEEEDDGSPRPSRRRPEGFKKNIPNPPVKDLRSVVTKATATKNFGSKKPAATAASAASKVPKSGLSRKEALEEVDKLQKQILALQTVKEFVKNSYDNAIARYRETDEQIKELQERVSILQDELGEGVDIEDDEARRLMAGAALKSCQEALTQLQEKQEKSLDETKIESKRVKDAKAKLGSLMDEFHYDRTNSEEPRVQRDFKEIAETKDLEENAGLTQKKQELQQLKENIKERFENSSNSSLSVAEMAEKIDELVNKVITLETSVSSQTAMVKRLRTETDDLQGQIRTLENDKESLVDDRNKLYDQLRKMEEKMHGLQDLNQILEDQNNNLQIQFSEAHSNLGHISEKVKNVQPGEEAKTTDLSHTQKDSSTHAELKSESEGQVPLNKERKDIKSEKDLKAGLVDDATNKEHKVAGTVEDDATDKEHKVAGTVEGDVTSDKKLKVTGSPFANEHKVTGSLENDVTSDKKLEITGSQFANEPKVTGSLENGVKSVNDVTSDKKLETTGPPFANETTVPGSLENDVTSDKKLEITGSQFANEPKVTGSLENDVKSVNDVTSEKKLETTGPPFANEPNVPGTLENDVKSVNDVTSDKKLETTGPPFANEPNVPGSLENDAKSANEVKVTSSLEIDGATPVEKISPKEFQEQEKTVNPSNGDEKAKVAVSTTTENREVSQHPTSNKADSSSECSEKQQENDDKQSSCEKENALKIDPNGQATVQEDEPDWRQLFTNGMKDREKVLLTEYTNTLRNYKDVKKRLAEIEKKNQDSNSDSSLQLTELKTSNAMKDEEIKHLRQKLGLMQKSFGGNEDFSEELLHIEPPESTTSPIEEKFRANMDEILEENLNFWLRFSAYYSEVQKFETTIGDLLTEISKLEDKRKSSEGSSNIKYTIKSDARPIYKHLTEIQSEMTLWMERGAVLKEELQSRFTSLCRIQEEITAALKTSAEDDDFRFTSYEAAKFQGEILNMKQENNKVADELQAGLDSVTSLHLHIEKTLVKLNDEFGFSASKRQQNGQLRQSENRAKVPLRSFIFGTKPKKQSIFSMMTPGTNRKYR